MAYNTKYLLKYCDRYGVPLRIELQLENYVGKAFLVVNQGKYVTDQEGRHVTVNIDGEYDPDRDMNKIEASTNPFSLQYRNDIGEKGGTIRATSATMSFYEDRTFNIDDLQTSDETGIRCLFFYDDQIEWIGFVTPDFFNVEITSNPVVNLTASDRIGILKDVDYVVEDLYTDERVSLLSILIKCLKETGLELNLNIACRMYCDQFAEIPAGPEYAGGPVFEGYEFNNFLQDTFVSELRFVSDEESEETLDCYTIIKNIMDMGNCVITQRRGEWWVVNKKDLEVGNSIVHHYDTGGVYIPRTNRQNFGETYFNLIDVGGQRTIIPAGAKNTYLLDHGDNRLYPVNRTLRGGLVDVQGWSKGPGFGASVNVDTVPTEYDSQGSIIDYDIDSRSWFLNRNTIYDIVSWTGLPSTAMINDQGYYVLQSKLFPVPTLDRKRLSFDLTVKAVGKPGTSAVIMVGLEFSDGFRRYAGLRYYPNSNRYDFTFSKVPGDNGPYDNISTGPTLNTINLGFENKYNNINLASEQEFKISVDAAGGVNQGNLDLTTAKMFIRIYPNKAQGPADQPAIYTSTTIKEVRIEFKSDDQTPKGTVYQTILQERYTKPTERRTVLFGDYQTVGQNGFFYKYREDSLSIQYNNAGDRLKDWWTPFDQERNPMLMHSLRQLTQSYGRSHDELSIGFNAPRIDPLSQFAIRCHSIERVTVNDGDYLVDDENRYVTARIGRYLNNKRFVLVEGEVDYLRAHFSGKLAQVINSNPDTQEYIYSQFSNEDII
ncbi:hypothetical protein [Sphingobacterium griseoflavum]|uniref:Prophage tail endopeptidase domain-containing protein n=1 Tax=Sphingobacterium griseoflavum TaxID=1474952 RepID=A0ABQ3HU64_9SPHI|nr:hypothetical protein [Sphingobacterium griseoflavum]GHE34950.1 hypothetical protein GCM10017764_17660 [Sphingobacterium griseoflavum]